MLKDSIDAFINNDSIMAKNVCIRDSELDNIREENFNELMELMKTNKIDIVCYI